MNNLKALTQGELPVVHFTGRLHLLLVGEGTVRIKKSIQNKDFYCMTDASGEIVEFTGDSPSSVLFNSELESTGNRVHYALELVQGEVYYHWEKGNA